MQDQVVGGEAAPTLCRRKVDARAVMADAAVCRARIQPQTFSATSGAYQHLRFSMTAEAVFTATLIHAQQAYDPISH